MFSEEQCPCICDFIALVYCSLIALHDSAPCCSERTSCRKDQVPISLEIFVAIVLVVLKYQSNVAFHNLHR